MSSIYVLEPPTKGKVIIETTHGPIDIELWPKEAPKSVRNFVQLCLEGYFDNTIFHRVIPGFLVQGGDPTGSGTGGESIYGGGVFGDEFHSRLRFNHRGIVAMANESLPNTNGSQFFFTLDKCDWLDKKHTIFGKVTGDSIYNLLRLGEVDTTKDDRPLDPAPKILSVEVLWNPFEDIVPRVLAKALQPVAQVKEPPKKPVKKLNLLSFGEEAEEEEKELAAVKQKIKSSHDVLNDPRLLKAEPTDKEKNAPESKELLSVREALSSKKEREALSSKKEAAQKDKRFSDDEDDDHDEDESKFDAKMRSQVLNRRKEMGDTPSKPPPTQKKKSSSVKGLEEPTKKSEATSSEDEKPRMEKLSLKRKGIGSEAKAERMENGDSDLQLYNASESARQLHKLKKRKLQGKEDAVLAKLEKFKQSISKKPFTSTSEPDDENKDEDVSDWKKVKLKFAPERGKSRKDDVDAYNVVDPLLEKGKEKFNRMQAKQKRREREWSGKSLA